MAARFLPPQLQPPLPCSLPACFPVLAQEPLDAASTGYQAPLPESEVRPLQDEDHLAGEADGEGEEGGYHRRGRGGRGRWAAGRDAGSCLRFYQTLSERKNRSPSSVSSYRRPVLLARVLWCPLDAMRMPAEQAAWVGGRVRQHAGLAAAGGQTAAPADLPLRCVCLLGGAGAAAATRRPAQATPPPMLLRRKVTRMAGVAGAGAGAEAGGGGVEAAAGAEARIQRRRQRAAPRRRRLPRPQQQPLPPPTAPRHEGAP